jgi:hypothetical protein
VKAESCSNASRAGDMQAPVHAWLGHRWDMAHRTTAVTSGLLRLAQLCG